MLWMTWSARVDVSGPLCRTSVPVLAHQVNLHRGMGGWDSRDCTVKLETLNLGHRSQSLLNLWGEAQALMSLRSSLGIT